MVIPNYDIFKKEQELGWEVLAMKGCPEEYVGCSTML